VRSKYARLLGPLAFGVIVARGVIHGWSLESTVPSACIHLFAFAAIGYMAGLIAETTIEQSVRERFEAEVKDSLEAESTG
jgi:hypothetical protein